MGDSLDIQNLLQTGYFTTSRARGGVSSVAQGSESRADNFAEHSTRPLYPPASPTTPSHDTFSDFANERRTPRKFENDPEIMKPPRAAVRAPPPMVEDEVESLAKEHGATAAAPHPEEVPPSRGEFQQENLMEEVHEHNPERRFLVVTDPTKAESSGSDSEVRRQRKREGRPRRSTIDEKSRPQKVHEPVFDDKSDSDRPPLPRRRLSSRRKSRNELPRIDTGLYADEPRRSRTKSAVGGRRPDFFDTGSQRYDDSMLSPDVIKHGSSRRDKGRYADSPNDRPSHTRSFSNSADDREYARGGASPTYSKHRDSKYNEDRKHDRRLSGERPYDHRSHRDDPSYRSHRREGSKTQPRDDVDTTRGSSTGRSREPKLNRDDSRSSDEHVSRRDRDKPRRRRDSVIIQDERRSVPSLEGGVPTSSSTGRPPSRNSNVPMMVPSASAPSDIQGSGSKYGMAAAAAAGAAGVAMAGGVDALNSRQQSIPSSEREIPAQPTETKPSVERRAGATSNAGSAHSLPDGSQPSAADADVRDEPRTTFTPASPLGTPATSSQPWAPGSFVPERDGLPVDRPVGSYRRYSENVGADGPPRLPECRFTKPVAGAQGWLTLPRSDFNICSNCYGEVFGDTAYRLQFAPMLYALDRPIACDFGSSPWYRIAWLLTDRHQVPDLRLFYSLSQVATACRHEPCPKDRKASRNWLTIIDPYTRRPIPNFAVCLHCARAVEALLPDLRGVFQPLHPRSEALRDVCALHFTPQRKEFVMYFDALETAADEAHAMGRKPNLDLLAQDLEKLSIAPKCPKDDKIRDAHWHTMQYCSDFTVCTKCFGEVVQPWLEKDNRIARNFLKQQTWFPQAGCQLYSDRMRIIFNKACERNDAEYLAGKLRERKRKEDEIHDKLMRLDRKGGDKNWTAEQVALLLQEWSLWE